MKTNTLKKQTKLTAYLALTAGAGLAATAADGATVVTFYGPGARTTSTSPPTPTGMDFGSRYNYNTIDPSYTSASYFKSFSGLLFTRGTDNGGSSSSKSGTYRNRTGLFINGATAGDENYANISFGTGDGIYEAVAQFNFDGTGGGYLVAIAQNSDNTALSISAGKAAIDAVPEPSSLALLALGSAGLLARRNRKLAA